MRRYPESFETSRRWLLCLASCIAVLCVAVLTPPAQAQTRVDPDFTVQRFNPAPGPRNFVVTRGARTDGEMAYSAGLVFDYAYLPFVVRSCITETGESCDSPGARQVLDVKVVENTIMAHVMGTFTPTPRLQLGLRLPVGWANGQGIRSDGLNDPEGLEAVALSDPEFEAKYRVHGEVTDPFVLGLAGNVTAPIGQLIAEGKYLGDTTPTGAVRIIIDGAQGAFGYAVNLGGAYRGRSRVGRAVVGSEARYGAGAGYQFSPVFRLMVDVFGSTRFTSASGENALEGLAAARIQPISSTWQFSVGAGTTLIQGIGTPDVRAFLGVATVMERRDDDGDGIENKLDQCPNEAEDFDGFEDADGCPDRDNDMDGIADINDKCPNQPEDLDGFEDMDGCPDLDNDKDGIPDLADQCPNDPETMNGYQDADGCPDEVDRDNDGIPDDRDQCPDEPEDTDGFQDTDGCPDPDNDGDGIPDNQDECIDEPETMNGFEDDDGCPDEAPPPAKKRR